MSAAKSLSVANPKVAHAIADLIDFADNIVAQHERRPAAARSLRIEMSPNTSAFVAPCIGS
jgi:hypothetical protein